MSALLLRFAHYQNAFALHCNGANAIKKKIAASRSRARRSFSFVTEVETKPLWV